MNEIDSAFIPTRRVRRTIICDRLRTTHPERAVFHWFGDASLDDDLGRTDAEWYIFVLISVNKHSHRWKSWPERHRSEFGGRIHCSAQGGALTPAQCADVIGKRYADIVLVNVIHRQVFTTWLDNELEQRGTGSIGGQDASAAFWGQMLIKIPVYTGFCLDIQGRTRCDPRVISRIGEVTLNRRQEARTQTLITRISDLIGIRPTYLPGGHPWIDLADVHAWTAKRVLMQNEFDRWPEINHPLIDWHFPTLDGRGLHASDARHARIHAAKLQVEYRRVHGLPVEPWMMEVATYDLRQR